MKKLLLISIFTFITIVISAQTTIVANFESTPPVFDEYFFEYKELVRPVIIRIFDDKLTISNGKERTVYQIIENRKSEYQTTDVNVILYTIKTKIGEFDERIVIELVTMKNIDRCVNTIIIPVLNEDGITTNNQIYQQITENKTIKRQRKD